MTFTARVSRHSKSPITVSGFLLSRFGVIILFKNLSFNHKVLNFTLPFFELQQAETLLCGCLDEKYRRAVPEVAIYLKEGVGNQTRIDYGTGGLVQYKLRQQCWSVDLFLYLLCANQTRLEYWLWNFEGIWSVLVFSYLCDVKLVFIAISSELKKPVCILIGRISVIQSITICTDPIFSCMYHLKQKLTVSRLIYISVLFVSLAARQRERWKGPSNRTSSGGASRPVV